MACGKVQRECPFSAGWAGARAEKKIRAAAIFRLLFV
jgi:hypothetical protein